MEILSNDVITTYFLPFLTEGSRGFKSEYDYVDLVKIMLYRLKTGCQWRLIPLKEFFGDTEICWGTVYHHWSEWSKDGCWEAIWLNFLQVWKDFLDMSSVQIDGSHTPVKRGGQAVAYQGRKATKTTNILFLVDNQGVPLAMGEPQAGNHHDVFDIQNILPPMFTTIRECDIELNGLFLNADPGFDAAIVKTLCEQNNIFPNIKPRGNTTSTEPYEDGTPIFDELLYKDRSVVEHTNAWLDAYKMILTRFETSTRNFKSLHFLAFVLIFHRKIDAIKNPKNKN